LLRAFLKKIYEYIAEPLYVRLSRDVTIHTQSALSANLLYQEKAICKLLDEMAHFHLELERLKERREDEIPELPFGRNEDQMEKVLNKIDSHLALVQQANELQIPLTDLFEWQSKYGGMSAQVIRKVRRLEHQNQLLLNENTLMKQSLTKSALTNDSSAYISGVDLSKQHVGGSQQ
jgi:hypothetical protein